jgi:FKBP-type peptidyl-prolyl cis-trans isomerase
MEAFTITAKLIYPSQANALRSLFLPITKKNMKKIFIVVLSLSVCYAQAQKTAPKKTTTPSKAGLKSLQDSASYAIGLSVASFYKQQGFKDLNVTALSQAIKDVFSQSKTTINEATANEVIMKCMDIVQNEKVKPTIAASEKFLADNKKKSGVKTTASGLQYEVIRLGTGAKPLATDTVVVNYAGTLIDGTEFDNSYKRGQPIEFPLNRVIPGWTEGVQLMPAGSKFKFYIPYQLGYGVHGNGGIPGGAALIFEVELLSVKGK